ncbi:MAG: hypothetical protein OIN87_06855 [Candidatus Methanoperedens sp.]|nr:hypothetical protein [Candidatus Methanoperedens sp.]
MDGRKQNEKKLVDLFDNCNYCYYICKCRGLWGDIVIKKFESIGNGTYFEITANELKEQPEIVAAFSSYTPRQMPPEGSQQLTE